MIPSGQLLDLFAGYNQQKCPMQFTYPQAPSFGLTPCPLVTFTFGVLLLTKRASDSSV
jgi:hypothetical protein